MEEKNSMKKLSIAHGEKGSAHSELHKNPAQALKSASSNSKFRM
jgi:hypothetical protein